MDVNLCIRCKKLFQSSSPLTTGVCPRCFPVHEEDFRIVRNYIRQNPYSTIYQVSEASGINIEYIKQWIKEERIIHVSGSNKLDAI